MNIPNSFKNGIASAFYDKQIFKIATSQTTDSEGDVITAIGSRETSFYGNVNYTVSKALREELGIMEQVDVIITTSTDVNITFNDVIRYEDTNYKITDVFKRDSHLQLLGVICQ